MTLSQGETACERLKFCDSWTGWIPWKKTTVPLLPVSPGRNRAQSSWALKLGDGYNTADGYRKYLPLAWRGRHLGVGECTRCLLFFHDFSSRRNFVSTSMAAISLMKFSSNFARLLRVQISFNIHPIAKYAKPAAGMRNFLHRVS